MLRKTINNLSKFCFGPTVVFCAALALSTSAVHAEGDINKGILLANICHGCHNIPNYSIAFPDVYKVPRIQGQKAEYILYALQEYANGNRYAPGNRLASMPAIATSLSKQDMTDLAYYYSSLAQ